MHFFENNSNVSLHLSDLVLVDQTKSSKYSKIQIFQHDNLGKVFILDGEIQHVEAWLPLYHETIVHLSSAFIKKIETVLILGGGCFFAAKEVLKYESIKQVKMIEHDPKVIDIILRNYKHAREIIEDKRFHLEINDAFKAVNKLKVKFDLIINDSVDLVEYSKGRKENLFVTLSSKIKKTGVCTDLIYRHIFENKRTLKTISFLKKRKLNSVFSLVTVPEYPGVLHLLSIWGHNLNVKQEMAFPLNLIQKKWIKKPNLNSCEYYNPNFLKYYLYLPPYLKKAINGGQNI